MNTRGRIVVIDDEVNAAAALETLLREDGYEVSRANDGRAGLALLEQTDADVVVTDLRMPGMDGLELLERARPLAPRAAFVVVTAFATFDAAVTAGRHGAVEFLHKPFDAATVRAAILRALATAEAAGSEGAATGTLRFAVALASDPALMRPAFALLEEVLSEFGVALTDEERASLRFCVLETTTNALEHAHRRERARTVRLRATVSADAIECSVEDEGAGYRPSGDHERGLRLVRSLMDRVDVDQGGRRITFARRRTDGRRAA